MSKVPGNGAKIAGVDYTTNDQGEGTDLDLGPEGLKVESGSGHAAENDPTR